MMNNRSNLPFLAIGIAATAGTLYYLFSPYSTSKSRKVIAPVQIKTAAPAKDIYLRFRDPVFYLSLTPESQYTVLSSEIQATGTDYTLYHQISSTRSVTTKCRRDWDDDQLTFVDFFPVLSCDFKVFLMLQQRDQGTVEVRAEVTIEGSWGLRAFFGMVSPRQIRTRLERLRAHHESGNT